MLKIQHNHEPILMEDDNVDTILGSTNIAKSLPVEEEMAPIYANGEFKGGKFVESELLFDGLYSKQGCMM
jgi:hypothetical protein